MGSCMRSCVCGLYHNRKVPRWSQVKKMKGYTGFKPFLLVYWVLKECKKSLWVEGRTTKSNVLKVINAYARVHAHAHTHTHTHTLLTHTPSPLHHAGCPPPSRWMTACCSGILPYLEYQ
jgi:hypothetical protein